MNEEKDQNKEKKENEEKMEWLEPHELTELERGKLIADVEEIGLKTRTEQTKNFIKFLEEEEAAGRPLRYDYDTVKEIIIINKRSETVRNISFEGTLKRDIEDLYATGEIKNKWYFVKQYSPRMRKGLIEFRKIPLKLPSEQPTKPPTKP